MMGIDKIIPEVVLNLESDNKQNAILELIEVLHGAGKITDKKKFYKDLFKREKMMSTYCGYHIAIPHSKSKVVSEASFAFGRSNGIKWDENDDLVKYIVMLAIPVSDQEKDSQHLEMMSSIATLALEDDIRNRWENAKSKEEIIQTFF